MEDTTTPENTESLESQENSAGQEPAPGEATETTPQDGNVGEPGSEDTAPDPRDAEITRLRKEAAARRVKEREAREANEALLKERESLLKKVQTALGIGEEEEKSPEDLIKTVQQERDAASAERDELKAQLRQMKETEVLRGVCREHGANADLLIPYLKGSGGLPELGDDADDYAAQVAEKVKSITTRFRQFAETPAVPASSGNAQSPTPEGDERITEEDLKKLPAADVNRLLSEGKLNHLI